MSGESSWGREALMRLAASLLGLLFAVGALEVALHLLSAEETAAPRSVAVYEQHRTSGMSRPHMRFPARPGRDAERFRLMVVGDSFTWGTGIYHDDTYGRRLESLLERMDRQLDVVLHMYSRPGWNTQQELTAARRAVGGAQPDLILLGYCLNDAEPTEREKIDHLLKRKERREPRTAVGRFLLARSDLFALAWNRLENSRQKRAFNHYYRRIYERQEWQLALEALDGFRQLAWDAKAPLVVAVFPVFDQQFDADYSYAPLHRKVMDALAERDILAVDLLDAYRGVDTTRLAVEPFTDPHPNELAHRIASQYLAHYLVEEGLVPITREQRARVELSLRLENREGSS